MPEEISERDVCRVNINTASLKELQKITGVGPVIAQRIIEARPFYSLSDLIRVKGIGPITLEKIIAQDCAYVDESYFGYVSYGGNDGRTSGGDSTDGEEEDTEKPTICSQENLSPPTYSPVIINEVAWMGTTSSTDEWIELKNVTTSTVPLNEWQLIGTNTETNKIKIKIFFAESDTIASFYLLERDILSRSDDDPVPGITADKNFVGSINNEKFVLRLFNSECQLIDEVAANPNWPAGNKDKRRTMERDQGLAGWHTYCGDGENGIIMGTPRKENSQPPLPQPILEISTTTLSFEAQGDGENPATTTLTIQNKGETEMTWTTSITYGTTTPTPTRWLCSELFYSRILSKYFWLGGRQLSSNLNH